MKKHIVTQVNNLIKEYQNISSAEPFVLEELPPKPLFGFHQWADSKECEGGFLIENQDKQKIWVVFIKWNIGNEFYIILFPENKLGPIAEIHETVKNEKESLLKWRYKPTKQDGKNIQRKEYFSKYFLSVDVFISIPETIGDVSGFLNELIALSENRQKADNLDKNTPNFREGFPEGKLSEQLHKQRERSSILIKTVKKEALKENGKLKCQCCGFDFESKYGELGHEFIEAHHTKPISELQKDGEKTKKEDIALVCSNCHKMLHRRRPWLRIDELNKLINKPPLLPE